MFKHKYSMKKEIHIFFTALMFFTRIPCPKWVNHDPTFLRLSSKYFPLIGIIIGSIGAIGIALLLGLKFSTLREIEPWYIPMALIAGHSTSRFIATTLIYTHKYVRDTEDSKAKPAAKSMSLSMVLVSAIFGILPLFLFKNPWVFITLIPMYISKIYLGRKFKKWIGGQTGDCAGAVQQLSEVFFYLTLVALWKFIW